MFSKFEYDGKLNPTFVEGPFQLPLSTIRAYIQEPITPRSIKLNLNGFALYLMQSNYFKNHYRLPLHYV